MVTLNGMASLVAGACFVTTWTAKSGGTKILTMIVMCFWGWFGGGAKGGKVVGSSSNKELYTRETTQKAE